MRHPIFHEALVLSAAIRIFLVIYSEYHDAHSMVKYTDVDYRVFTDAAWFLLNLQKNNNHVAQGPFGKSFGELVSIVIPHHCRPHNYLLHSPYARDTYRYTPLLALLMTPNELIHPSFGKVLFSLCDLFVGAMLYNLFCTFPPISPKHSTEVRRQATLWVSTLWLLNPLVFTISTRGSSESVLGLLVVGTLFLAMKGRLHLAALFLGLSVHWKIYPVVYGTSLLACIGAASHCKKTKSWLSEMINAEGITFAVLSGGTFSVVTGVLYLV